MEKNSWRNGYLFDDHIIWLAIEHNYCVSLVCVIQYLYEELEYALCIEQTTWQRG
jgi:hypothetical protein